MHVYIYVYIYIYVSPQPETLNPRKPTEGDLPARRGFQLGGVSECLRTDLWGLGC